MCPACYATVAMVVAGVTSASGLTAVVATKVYKSKRAANAVPVEPKRKEENDKPGNRPS